MADVFVELSWGGGVFIILTKPTHCSYVFDPIPFTSFNCSRFTKAPFSSRHAKIAFAFFSFKPAMRLKRKMSRYLSFMAKFFKHTKQNTLTWRLLPRSSQLLQSWHNPLSLRPRPLVTTSRGCHAAANQHQKINSSRNTKKKHNNNNNNDRMRPNLNWI